MNQLLLGKRCEVLSMLVEGNSLRSASRLADVSINTVTKLLIDVGKVCAEYQDKIFVNLKCQRIQVDEIWSFCYVKQKSLETAKNAPEHAGDVYTWTSLCPDTKIVPTWLVGKRDAEHAKIFIADLSERIPGRLEALSQRIYLLNAMLKSLQSRNLESARLIRLCK